MATAFNAFGALTSAETFVAGFAPALYVASSVSFLGAVAGSFD